MNKIEIDKLAKIIWNYMVFNQDLFKADAILALGSNDIRVADRTAEIYKRGYAPFILCSGGLAHQNDPNKPPWNHTDPQKTEAIAYKERLIELGVPENVIFLEEKAKNTGDNVNYSKKFIEEKNFNWKSFIVIQKRFSERRVFATFKKQWPDIKFCVTSPQLSYDEYMNSVHMPNDKFFVPKDTFLKVMLGELKRIKENPKKGFQIEQEMSEEVWDAHTKLVGLGYDY